MINVIWCSFIVISILFAIVTGNLDSLNDNLFSSINDTTQMIINIFGSICFWCGMIKIISETSLRARITNLIQPLNRFLFKNIDKNSKAYENININLVTNMLGIGNAATPAGIKAMEEMEKNNPYEEKLSDNMVMFLAINTASLQLIPTNIISIRSSLGSENPGQVIPAVWFSSILAFVSIVLVTKMYLRLRRKR